MQSLGRKSPVWRLERHKLHSDSESRSFAFFLKWTKEHAQPGVAGLGLVVGRRVGNAVTRQKVKRRLRHSFLLASRHVVGEINCICIIQGDGCLKKSFQDLASYFRTFLGQCGVLKDDVQKPGVPK